MRLGLAMNFAVFCYEIKGMHLFACHIAQKAISDSLADIGSLSEESFRDSTAVMQLLRDNLLLWNGSDTDSVQA
jgi:14-3-3 protein epsilon